MMFNERKVAQVAAFFLGQVPEGRMSHLKLMNSWACVLLTGGIQQCLAGYVNIGTRWVYRSSP